MPNFVLLMSDEHNPSFSSVYGHPLLETPSMACLAERGTVYQSAYCPSPLCLPSRSAFMSGRHVHQIQTYNNCNLNLDPSLPSYGALLSRQGYRVAYIGKTDVYAPGEALGFSEMILPGDRNLPGDLNIARQPLRVRSGAASRADGYGPREESAARDRACIDAAERWIRAQRDARDGWGLVVNVTLPHFPQYARPDLWDRYPLAADLPAYGVEQASADHPYARDLRSHFEADSFSEQQARGLRRGYAACVAQVDEYLGCLLAALREIGQLDQTNVIYTSDHGDMLGKFGMWWKCSLYEDSVRIPCIAAGPDFQVGRRVDTPVSLHDVQATLFHSLRAERPADWLGQPLPTVRDDDRERVVFAEYHGHGTRASAYMVRRGRWKYIHYVAAEDQLFDLVDDPHELHNVIAHRPSIVGELNAALLALCSPERENARAEDFIRRQIATAARDYPDLLDLGGKESGK